MIYNELFEEIHMTQEESQPQNKLKTPDLRHILRFLKFDGMVCISVL